MKTILAISNTSSKGKSDTLREFANLLLKTYPKYKPIFPIPTRVSATKDFRLVVEIKGKIIGIESQGDPKTNLKKRLIELADKFECEIILCTTRTRGETIKAVVDIAKPRGFKTIWTSTYQIADKSNHKLVNRLKAKHLLDLLQELAVIK